MLNINVCSVFSVQQPYYPAVAQDWFPTEAKQNWNLDGRLLCWKRCCEASRGRSPDVTL